MSEKPETRKQLLARLNGNLAKALVGKKIVEARYITDREKEAVGDWHERGIVIFLEDNTEIVPVCDPEGNGPGSLYVGDQTFGPL